MDVFNIFKLKILDLLKKLPIKISDNILSTINFQVNAPKEKKFGDLSTNVALVLSKALNLNPVEFAQNIADKLLVTEKSIIEDIDIVSPGFINIYLCDSFYYQVLNTIVTKNMNNGLKEIGNNRSINIEYVSANPTGPMHIGHGRGAVIGDVLANLYSFLGYSVTKEYYINDAGNQIVALAMSVYYRYCEILEKNIEKPQEFYPGNYIKDIAKAIIKKDQDKWLNNSNIKETQSYFSEFSIAYVMKVIKKDLSLLNVEHNVFSSEKEISNEDAYNSLKKELFEKDLIYYGTLEAPKADKKNNQELQNYDNDKMLLFRTSKFGDDTDRVVEKKDGTRTYFANDMVYHYNKLKRSTSLVDVLGVDHKGYEKRLKAIVNALSDVEDSLSIVFTEMVNLLKDGKPFKMSKRAGNFLTLEEVLKHVPKDAFRIIMISRSNNSTLDLDVANISSNNENNPVYYIQYAYARINSVINKAKEVFSDITEENILSADATLLKESYEIAVIKELSLYQKTLRTSLQTNNVHLIFLYLVSISQSIHSLWNAGKNNSNLKFINESNKNLTNSRLLLLLACKIIMFDLFSIIGIEKPEKM